MKTDGFCGFRRWWVGFLRRIDALVLALSDLVEHITGIPEKSFYLEKSDRASLGDRTLYILCYLIFILTLVFVLFLQASILSLIGSFFDPGYLSKVGGLTAKIFVYSCVFLFSFYTARRATISFWNKVYINH